MDERKQGTISQIEESKDKGITSNGNSITMPEITRPGAKEKWDSSLEFLMSCIAMTVGLGNIWRFPFTAYQNGGGAFLIPYIVILVLVGRPLYYLEMSLGQFTSKGSVKTFESLATPLKGVGYCQVLGAVYIATYYCSLLAITVFYFLNSFTNELPWSYCRAEWEQENRLNNVTCIPSKESRAADNNSISSSELYFRREVLKEKEYIDDGIGLPDWKLTLCLAFCWFASFVIMRRGIKSSGKASYFLAIFPYVIILTLLIRAATLEGATNGMFYLINPDWSKLVEPQVWYAAASQCFFSLNVGFGNIISYASYNKFNHNIARDSIIITILDTFTSLISGTTIFGILGNLAFKLNVDVAEVINSGGTGLAFISYPEAIAKFDAVPWLFALIFFLMLFIVGMGSLISIEGSAYTTITEAFPNLKGWKLSLSIATVGFLISLIYITPGGQFIVNLIDQFGASMTCFVSNIVAICLMAWFYGLGNFLGDIEYMLKRRQGIYWRISWGLVTPVVLITILLYFLITMTRLKHEGRDYPDIALGFGWLATGLSVGQIPLWILIYYWRNRKLGIKKATAVALELLNWGPANTDDYNGWKLDKQERLLSKLRQKRFLQRIYFNFTGKIWKDK